MPLFRIISVVTMDTFDIRHSQITSNVLMSSNINTFLLVNLRLYHRLCGCNVLSMLWTLINNNLQEHTSKRLTYHSFPVSFTFYFQTSLIHDLQDAFIGSAMSQSFHPLEVFTKHYGEHQLVRRERGRPRMNWRDVKVLVRLQTWDPLSLIKNYLMMLYSCILFAFLFTEMHR